MRKVRGAPERVRKALRDALKAVEENPKEPATEDGPLNIRDIGRGRLRVIVAQDYRLIYSIKDDENVRLIAFGPRGDVYKGL